MTVPNTPGSHGYGDPQAGYGADPQAGYGDPQIGYGDPQAGYGADPQAGGGFQQQQPSQQGWAPSAYSAPAPGQEGYGYAPQGYPQAQPSGFGTLFSLDFSVKRAHVVAKLVQILAIVAGMSFAVWGRFEFIAVAASEVPWGGMAIAAKLFGAVAWTAFGLFLPALSRVVVEIALKPGENNRA